MAHYARPAITALHRLIARTPLAAPYLRSLGAIARTVPEEATRRGLLNSVAEAAWPAVPFGPRAVRLGGTPFRLHPHVGEFDFEALFTDGLTYEPEVVRWLEPRVAGYDAVVEVGANVGVYSCWMAEVARRADAATEVFAFEPSREAFARLWANVRANGADGRVCAFNAAVADEGGTRTFYEPPGALTNGSFSADFARHFSADAKAVRVLTVSGEFVEALAAPFERVLLKIDVEGAELEVIGALDGLLRTKRPDVIIEVLPGVDDQLNALDLPGRGYRLLHLTAEGTVERERFAADLDFRDYALVQR